MIVYKKINMRNGLPSTWTRARNREIKNVIAYTNLKIAVILFDQFII